MAIETECPGCGRKLRVADDYAGAKARCPACNTIYIVPSGGDSEPEQQAVAPEVQWYMKTPEGQVFGPVVKSELDRWLSEGRISAECMLRSDDTPQWSPAGEYYGVLSSQLSGAVSSASPAYGQAGAYRAGAGRPYTVAHRGGIVLVFGILGWVFTCPIFSVVAWIMGSSDLREMRSGRMDPSGMGLTQAGRVLGMVYSILWIVGVVIFMLVFILAAAAGGVH